MTAALQFAPSPRLTANRRQAVLDAAAARFSNQGYDVASMRDIAKDAGMLAGSMYYHFASKEELLFAVHEAGVARFEAAVAAALAGQREPWARLEAAVVAHLETLLAGGDFTRVVIRELPREPLSLRDRLAGLRDGYEALFRQLIDDLPLPPDADRSLLRLMLMGAMNWSQGWYRPGGQTPAQIGRGFISLLKKELRP
ncbi:MAG: TetR/AcrR family transcriptional regulator [Rhodospirillales bacterium]|jgi:AcrR family transcriptional regulator